MKIIVGILAWLAVSFAVALITGAFIHAGMGGDCTKEDDHAKVD